MASQEEIKRNAIRLEEAGATEQEIEEYVSTAVQELGQPIQATATQEQAGDGSLRFPTGTSTVTGMTPQQAQERGEAGMAGLQQGGAQAMASGSRYGLPVLAGMATAPFTGGMSVPASVALASGVGGASSAVGEFLAQSIEGQEDPRRLVGAAVLGATPFRTTGGVLARAGTNIPAAIASGELASFIEMGADEYKEGLDGPGAMARRMILPGAITGAASVISAKASRAAEGARRKAEIEIGRKGGSALISEFLPGMEGVEAGALKRGNARAIELYRNMDKEIGPEILSLYPSIPETSTLAARLRDSVGTLNKLRNEYGRALADSQAATEAAATLRQTNPEQAAKLTATARKKAFEATQRELLYKEGLMKAFGGGVPDLGEIAEGRRMQSLQKLTQDAKVAVKESVGELYASAGIGINDPVAHVDDILSGFDAIQDDVARGEVRRQFVSFIERTPEAVLEDGSLKLSAYRRLQQDIASELVSKGKDPKYANRIAGEAYSIVKEASEGFLQQAIGEGGLAAWRAANDAAAGVFAASKSDAIDMLAKGNASGLYQKIKAQGAGQVMDELQAYEQAIANSSVGGTAEAMQRSREAAQAFRQNYMKVIRDSAIDNAVDRSLGLEKDLLMIDPVKLSQELQELSSKRFPIGELGLGSPERIKSLARIASAGNPRGLTVEQFDEFLREASTLGADKAAYRQAYFQEVRNSLLEQGAERKGQANAKVLRAARRAKADEETVRMAYQRAEADPLVRLLDDTSMKLSPDVSNNTLWVGKLMALEPSRAKGFMRALETSGRKDVAEEIRKAAAASQMRAMLGKAPDGRDVVNLKKVNDFFYSSDTKSTIAREAFEEIVGKETYQKLRNAIAVPVSGLMEARFKLDAAGAADLGQIQNNMRFRGSAGSLQGYSRFSDLLNMVQSGRYNVAHLLHVHPRFSREYARAAGSIEKFAAQNAVNAAALRYAMLQDEKSKEASAQR